MRVWELDKTYTKLTGSGKEILIDQAREAPALWHSGEKYLMFHRAAPGGAPTRCCMPESSAIFGSWRLIDDPCRGPGARRTFGAQSAAVFAATVSLTFCLTTGTRTICAIPATRFCPSPLKTACYGKLAGRMDGHLRRIFLCIIWALTWAAPTSRPPL